ncbi:bifunctional UDP-N-acetylmuramoyl-tripeptide:D-alanyl-D-alanine ligase/alanine racemase [Marinilabilia rubra]|uniref:Alanine racemase n=1 Tax=Marinilabilia rubra TaxID=2162893 RepID=A0A2U2B647_9BACT|nr:bifunctional UDP-N-acetylmuramoyl-tripeptide:D-alanyl-D-alanine ligase/alanine racemase [Marinilabilia rubra]PWD98551.1 bifunctional UDP-N-acetylmuramoyl-tripeptide:D-alanyl-D-alanine ligase/alanine racemase [Marinilabilia rubra]
MITYSLQQIADACNGQLTQNAGSLVSRLLIDSRSVYDASETLFFALKGNRHDGHQFILQLFKKGVPNFVVEEGKIPADIAEKANWIEVKDTKYALQQVGAFHRSRFKIPVLGITGSNGKTIVKEWITQMMGSDVFIARSPRSYNSQVGVPVSLWHLNEQSQLGIFEAGISLPGEMKRLKNSIMPTLGLFTTLGPAHQENFSSLEEKLEEKLNLFEGVEVIFYGCDQEMVDERMISRFSEKQLLTWGRAEKAALQLISQAEVGDQMRLGLKWKKEHFEIAIPFTDRVSVENALPVILFLLYRGYDKETIKERMATVVAVGMRLEQKEGINNNLLINDTYNADFTSLEVALDFLVQQSRKKGVARTVILSDLLQTGIPDHELYPLVSTLIEEKQIDRFIGVGPSLMKYASLFEKSAGFFETTEELLHALPSFHFSGEAILLKGSRRFSFERVVNRLELKRHATVMEINLDAMVHNLNQYRKQLGPETKVLAMVKAFSYGSGSYEIAAALEHQNVDYLGVAFADEGMELRRAGISTPIIVMNPEEKSFGQMIDYNLEPEIYNFRVLEAFNSVVESDGPGLVPVHIKIDTGMNRMGFLECEMEELVRRLKKMPALRVKSVFSHLAGSGDETHDVFTFQQIQKFEQACKYLQSELNADFWMHILNSAGIERFRDAKFDMVRLGIGLYGFGVGELENLRNVVTLKSYISQIKPVASNETIGYNRSGALPRDGFIGIVPVGYADGLNRHLSNRKGKMMVNGRLAPIVGDICMDMCMVDITGIQADEGDEVVVFGDDYPLTNLARQLDTIPYEILTSISRRVSRVYFKE